MMAELNWKRICHLWLVLGLVGYLVSCKEVPEGLDRPFTRITWDTVVSVKRIILPGDTLVLIVDGSSQAEENQVFIQLGRNRISPIFEFLGPDSDWVFQSSYKVEGKVIKKATSKWAIPEGLRPGIYQFKGWSVDAAGRLSDTSRFSFVLNTRNYPAISILRPQNISSPVLIPFDTLKAAYHLPLKLQGAPAVGGFGFYFQWLDSTGLVALSDSMPLDGKVVEGNLDCDTVLVPPSLLDKRFRLKIGYQTPEKRRMEYRFSLYRK